MASQEGSSERIRRSKPSIGGFTLTKSDMTKQQKKRSVLESRQNVLDLVAQTGQESTMPREARVEFRDAAMKTAEILRLTPIPLFPTRKTVSTP